MNKKKITAYLLILFMVFSCTTGKNNVVDGPEVIAAAVIEEVPVPQVPHVYFEGRLLNIFFHPLVSRPETAFRSRHRDHFLEWYVTAEEYKKVLYELYLGDYVLVDINELYNVTYTDGRKRVTYQRPFIPEGKKPMILSIDDLNYYDFVRASASVHKLIIDNNGNIAAWTDNERGGEISYDLDVVTYLEEFIKKYPDFSIRGARGIIAPTGYQGVLGYQTQLLNSPSYQEEKAKAIAVVNKLKELGWRFSSHSYGHPNLPNISMEAFIRDADRWDAEVRPIVGDTDLYIYPYGAGVEHIEAKHKALRDRNFNVFFGVGHGWGHIQRQEYLYFDRRNIDGFYFRVFRDRADKLFDFDKVVDTQARSIR